MGFVDRGGGREAKGASLRRSKKNPGAAAARKNTAPKQTTPAQCTPPAAPACLAQRLSHVDASVAILARKLEADRAQLMERAAEESGVAVALTWCADLERQEALIEFCRQHGAVSKNGQLYCVVGVHVNNVERTHTKVQEAWVENVIEWGRHSEVLGVLSGLNLERSAGTHFAQEWLLEQLWNAAGTLQVPLVLHIHHKDGSEADSHRASCGPSSSSSNSNSGDRAAELLTELLSRDETEGAKKPTAVVLHNGIGAMAESAALRAVVERFAPTETTSPIAGSKNNDVDDKDNINNKEKEAKTACGPFIYVLATAEGLSQSKATSDAGGVDSMMECNERVDTTVNSLYAKTLSAHVALSQLLIGTSAPWYTPQNIPDPHLCTMPNEPANYRYVSETIHTAMVAGADPDTSLGIEDLMDTARDNFLRVFFSATYPSPSPAPEMPTTVSVSSAAAVRETARAVPVPSVHLDPTAPSPAGADAAVSADSAAGHFLCLRCRRRLFPAAALRAHPPDAARAAFGPKRPAPGKAPPAACESVCFVRIASGSGGGGGSREPSGTSGTSQEPSGGGGGSGASGACGAGGAGAEGLVVQGGTGTVHCGGCGGKLGTAGADAKCPCGCIVAGHTARIAASKVEAPVRRRAGGDLEELLAQAAREREEMERGESESDGECGNGEKRRKEPKKNVKANNRSNFTHFRNKNFAPRGLQGQRQGEESDGEGEESPPEETQRHTGRRRKNRR